MISNRGKKSKITLISIVVACLLFLPGCWGKREVEKLAPLFGIGIDLGEKPATFLITVQFAMPKKGDASGAEIEDRTISIEASSAREAFEKVSKVTFRTPFLGSLNVIIIGEDLAKEGGFNDILDFNQRFSEFRRTMYVVLAKGKAQDILNSELRSGSLPSMHIKNMIESGEEVSNFPTVRLGHYLTILATKSTAPIFPVLESVKSGEGIEYKAIGNDEAGEMRLQGAGVFNGDRLEDFLTDQETKGYMWMENEVSQRLIDTVDLEENSVSFGGRVLKSTTKYKVNAKSGKMELQYLISATITINEVIGLKKQLSGAEWVELTKEAESNFAKVIRKECESSLKKQRELELDFLGIGRHIEQKNSTYWKTIKDQWKEEIEDFPVSLEVQVRVHNTGLSSSSAVNSTGEGQE